MCYPVPAASADIPFDAVLAVVAVAAEQRFRGVRCPQTRDDAVAEVVALAWVRFRLDPAALARPAAARRFAGECAAAVRAGCRLADAAAD